jgi:RNA polymerase sigma-70 factor (ECF subfamily)
MPRMSEPVHMVRVAGASAAAEDVTFEEFFEREKVRLYRALCLITRNRFEAEELTQDAFVRVLERWDRVGEMTNPSGYLYRTAMNTFRKSHRRAALAARRTFAMTPVDDGIAGIDAEDAAVRALAGLSPRQRAAVVLVDLLGYQSDEAAQILGMRAGTVRTHVARGHAVLKETMER